MSRWAAVAVVALVVAWLPEQGSASAVRSWLFTGILPLALCVQARVWRGLALPRRATPWVLLTAWTALCALWVPAPGAAVWQALLAGGLLGGLALGMACSGEAEVEQQVGRGAALAGAIASASALWPGSAAGGLLGNADLLAGFLALAAVWSVGAAWNGAPTRASEGARGEGAELGGGLAGSVAHGARRWRWALGAGAVLSGGSLLWLGSLGAAVAAMAGLGALAIAWVWRRRGASLAVVCGALLAGGSAALALSNGVVVEHLRGRQAMVAVSGLAIREQGVLGAGPGQFPGAWMNAQARWGEHNAAERVERWTHAHHAHNEVLQAAVELGLPGALLLTLPFALALFAGPRRHATAWAALVAFSALALVSLPLYEPTTAFLASFAAGLLLWRAPPSLQARWAGAWRRVAGIAALVVATAAFGVASADLLADQLLVRGVRTGAPDVLAMSQQLALRPARAMLERASAMRDASPEAAAALALEGARRDPSPMTWGFAGELCFAAGRLEAATDALNEAVRLQPWFFAGHFDLALVWQARGDHDRARQHAERARSLKPEDPRLRRLP